MPGPGVAWSGGCLLGGGRVSARGVSAQGGVCSGGCLVRGVPGEYPPPGRPLLRAVHILLECIVVL